MRYPVAILLVLLSLASAAQNDYQVLRGEAQGFARVTPGKVFEFPRDHMTHPKFRIEWWYITANMQDDSGNSWGLQWTLFRNALDSKVDSGG